MEFNGVKLQRTLANAKRDHHRPTAELVRMFSKIFSRKLLQRHDIIHLKIFIPNDSNRCVFVRHYFQMLLQLFLLLICCGITTLPLLLSISAWTGFEPNSIVWQATTQCLTFDGIHTRMWGNRGKLAEWILKNINRIGTRGHLACCLPATCAKKSRNTTIVQPAMQPMVAMGPIIPIVPWRQRT